MNSNVFKFGDMLFRQKNGTATGTPCACDYAILYVGYFELKTIIPKYGKYFLLFKRFIDDGILLTDPKMGTFPKE